MLKDEYKVYEEKMRKSIDSVAADFAAVRAGRANAAVLDRISVDYYGTPTPIQQIASIGSPDPRQLLIQPWDASAVKLIEKAILNSDLGINPQNVGKAIRLSFPQLTEEMFSQYLYSNGLPDPELLIRPGGEKRISNYLLWQCAYSEFYFCDTLWPDFDEREFDKALIAYQHRERRFGGVKP